MAIYESSASDAHLFIPGSALLEKLYEGTKWGEGPVYFGDLGTLLWSDIPNDRILQWSEETGVSLFRKPAHNANGNTRDREGRLVTCEHGSRSVVRTEYDGSRTVLANEYEGKRLNSPNDLAVKSDGTIWFTDPTYGIITDYEGNKSEQELEGCYVFCLDPAAGTLRIVADDFVMPNGIAFAPDEKTLYISDTGRGSGQSEPPHIRSFTVRDDNTLEGGSVFADMKSGASDGFRLDTEGNLWTSAGKGIACFRPNGELVLRVAIPEAVANLTFGGPKRNRLFMTAHTSLYALYTGKRGAQWP
ncbi:MAG: SMP-30/gluconolactonase/LRE family protein [Spirochaetales bacterium]